MVWDSADIDPVLAEEVARLMNSQFQSPSLSDPPVSAGFVEHGIQYGDTAESIPLTAQFQPSGVEDKENQLPATEEPVSRNIPSTPRRRERKSVLQKIEEEALRLITAIPEDRRRVVLTVKEGGDVSSLVKLYEHCNARRFTILTAIMGKTFALLQENRVMTKRDLYYENVDLYRNQQCVNAAIDDLCCILEISPSQLPFVASAKGLMAAGSGVFIRNLPVGKPVEYINIGPAATLIPPVRVVRGWGKLESNAKFLLIVEKDAIFQRLIEDRIFDAFGPFILITGKGYPDKATRIFASKLTHELKIPAFVLVDADPYGLEIAAIYKWGTQTQNKRFTNESAGLLLPNLILLGVLPSELPTLKISEEAKIPLNARDKKKLATLLARLADKGNDFWIDEVDRMEELGYKVEIEALAFIGENDQNYLSQGYLQKKISFHMEIYD